MNDVESISTLLADDPDIKRLVDAKVKAMQAEQAAESRRQKAAGEFSERSDRLRELLSKNAASKDLEQALRDARESLEAGRVRP